MRTTKPIRLIGTAALAAKLNVHPVTVSKLVKTNPNFPRPTKLFNKNMWDEDKVDAYIAARMAVAK
jgi:predicted DNA-binding transcriptional regulator AlpA